MADKTTIERLIWRITRGLPAGYYGFSGFFVGLEAPKVASEQNVSFGRFFVKISDQILDILILLQPRKLHFIVRNCSLGVGQEPGQGFSGPSDP